MVRHKKNIVLLGPVTNAQHFEESRKSYSHKREIPAEASLTPVLCTLFCCEGHWVSQVYGGHHSKRNTGQRVVLQAFMLASAALLLAG